MNVRRGAGFILLWLVASGAAAEIYKCTDAQGRIRYTDTPCTGESRLFTPRAAPPVDADTEARQTKTRRLLDALREEREQKQAAAAEVRAEQERRARNCNNARDHYRRITEANRLYRLDEAGNRVVLNDAQRTRATERARAAVEQWCK
jgi:hypothetical protein